MIVKKMYCKHCKKDTEHEKFEPFGTKATYWICDECGNKHM